MKAITLKDVFVHNLELTGNGIPNGVNHSAVLMLLVLTQQPLVLPLPDFSKKTAVLTNLVLTCLNVELEELMTIVYAVLTNLVVI